MNIIIIYNDKINILEITQCFITSSGCFLIVSETIRPIKHFKKKKSMRKGESELQHGRKCELTVM